MFYAMRLTLSAYDRAKCLKTPVFRLTFMDIKCAAMVVHIVRRISALLSSCLRRSVRLTRRYGWKECVGVLKFEDRTDCVE